MSEECDEESLGDGKRLDFHDADIEGTVPDISRRGPSTQVPLIRDWEQVDFLSLCGARIWQTTNRRTATCPWPVATVLTIPTLWTCSAHHLRTSNRLHHQEIRGLTLRHIWIKKGWVILSGSVCLGRGRLQGSTCSQWRDWSSGDRRNWIHPHSHPPHPLCPSDLIPHDPSHWNLFEVNLQHNICLCLVKQKKLGWDWKLVFQSRTQTHVVFVFDFQKIVIQLNCEDRLSYISFLFNSRFLD
jgi:hypothetical protein